MGIKYTAALLDRPVQSIYINPVYYTFLSFQDMCQQRYNWWREF